MHEQPVETTLYSLAADPPRKRKRPRAERHLSLFRVGVLAIAGRRELCLIRNVSAGGMLVRAYSEIPAGTPVSIELKQGQSIAGTAKWVDGECVGVAFDKPVDVISLISPGDQGPRPRMPRIEVDCVATVRDGAKIVRTRGLNVSQGGVRVESKSELPVGANVIVSLSGLSPEPGVIRWKDGACYGIAFNRVLPVGQLVAWLRDRQQRLQATG